MQDETGELEHIEFREKLEQAFEKAYPDIPVDDARHMARNLTQVITGTIDIGEKVGASGDVSHMDVANAFVYWSTCNTYLEDIHKGKRNADLTDVKSPSVSDGEMHALTNEFVARTADLLLGLEVLAGYPEMYRAFVRGSVALGASHWERSRGKLAY